MNIDIKKETVKSSETVFSKESAVMSEADIIVPDSKNDIGTVLQISGTPRIESCEVQGDKIIITGNVQYTILYQPEGIDGKVESIVHTHGFTDVCESRSIGGDDISARADAELEGIDYNLINSRKINIRGTIALTVTAMHERELEVPVDATCDFPIEIKRQQMDTFSVVADEDIVLTLPDKFELPSDRPAMTELLKTEAEVMGHDVKIITGKAIVKGAVKVCMLYRSDDSSLPADYYEHEFPFTEILDLPEVTEEMDCDVKYSVLSTYCEMDPSSQEVGAEATVSVHILATQPVTVSLMEDCFSPDHSLTPKCSEYKFNKVLKSCREGTTVRNNVILPEGCPPIMQIYRVMTKPFVENVTREGGAAVISGTVDTYILYLSSAPDMPLYSYKTEIPFTITVDNCNFEDGADIECDAISEGCSYSQTGEFSAEIRVSVTATLKIYSSSAINIIESISAEDEEKVPQSCITVYFVQQGDTMWDIAKRYKTPSDRICAANKLPENCPLNPGTALLIP